MNAEVSRAISMNIFHLLTAALLTSFSLGASSQVTVQIAPPAKEAALSSELLNFNCKASFNGHGVGQCAGLVQATLRDTPSPLKSVTFNCDVRVSYWWNDGGQSLQEFKVLPLSVTVAGDRASFASADLPFSLDLTSIAREHHTPSIARVACTSNWTAFR
jgi:hypothetical protein